MSSRPVVVKIVATLAASAAASQTRVEALTPAPTSAHASAITPAMTVADAFELLATSLADEAVSRVRKLSADAGEPEDLHKLRVALRRLRTLWWGYEPLLDQKDAKLQRREFKSLADAAGRTRDWDVLRELIAGDKATHKHALVSLIQTIDEHRAAALMFSVRAIGNAGVERILRQALTHARQQLDLHGVGQPLETFAEERVQAAGKALKKRIKRAVSTHESDYGALHEVRIAGKKLRYLLQFFSPVLARGHQTVIERLTVIQDELGTLNDLVTSEALLREYAFQLGEPKHVKQAIAHLQSETAQHMHHVHEALRASG